MITAAADGSSLSNPGPAGWAWYVDETSWAAGGWPHGTNNMGELMAVLDLLRATAGTDEPLLILCDSQYAINCCTKWLAGWKRKGWKKADGKPVLNRDLLEQLDVELTRAKAAGREIRFEWVKGHAGHDLNERADAAARGAATAYQQGKPVPTGPGYAGGDPSTRSARSGSIGEARSGNVGESRSPSEAQPSRSVPRSAGAELPDLFSVDADDPAALAAAEADADVRACWDGERALLTDVVRGSWRLASALLHPDFREFGSSGGVLTLASLRADLGPLASPIDVEPVETVRLGPDAILLVWRGRRGGDEPRIVNRSSVWVRHRGQWVMRFHQGTVAAD